MKRLPTNVTGKATLDYTSIPTKDLLSNTMTGAGTKADKDYYNKFIDNGTISVAEINALYKNDWLAAKIVDALPHDMIRAWRRFDGLKANQETLFRELENYLEVKPKIETGLKDARKYGGAGLLLGINDGKIASKPLDIDSLGKNCIDYIHALDCIELSVHEMDNDPFSPNYDKPKSYMLRNTVVHHSRVIPFMGVRLSRNERIGQRNWGYSIYQKTREALARSAVAYGAGSNLMHEASLDIISIEGFTNLVGDPVGEGAIMRRMSLAGLTKSVHNMLIKDNDEEFKKITQNFAGIPDMIREYVVALSGASEIPVTRLLGLSPSGLNATGEHDLINYYDSVHSRQNLILAPVLRKIDELMLRHLFGRVPSDFSYEFNSLWQPSRGQQVEMLKTSTEAYVQALQILPPAVVLRAIKKDPHFDITDKELEGFVKELERRVKENMKKEVAPNPNNKVN